MSPSGRQKLLDLQAKIVATERATERLRAFLMDPPEYGKITLCFQSNVLYRVVREDS